MSCSVKNLEKNIYICLVKSSQVELYLRGWPHQPLADINRGAALCKLMIQDSENHISFSCTFFLSGNFPANFKLTTTTTTTKGLFELFLT